LKHQNTCGLANPNQGKRLRLHSFVNNSGFLFDYFVTEITVLCQRSEIAQLPSPLNNGILLAVLNLFESLSVFNRSAPTQWRS
jgi:hypothetical protein